LGGSRRLGDLEDFGTRIALELPHFSRQG